MPLELKPPPPPDAKAKLALIGPPGAGKSYGAAALMRGLVGPTGKFVVINTEKNGTAFLPQNLKNFLQYDWDQTHSPERGVEILKELEAMKDIKGVVLDSATDIYEWMQQRVDQIVGNDKWKSMQAWGTVKQSCKKLLAYIMESDLHVILCIRAEDKLRIFKDEKGKEVVAKAGMQPVFDKKRMFDPHFAIMLRPERDTEEGEDNAHTFWLWKDRVSWKANQPKVRFLSVEYGTAVGKYLNQRLKDELAVPTTLAQEPLTLTIRAKKDFPGGKFAFTCDGEVLNTDPKTCEGAENIIVGDKIIVSGYKQLANVSTGGRDLPCYQIFQWRGIE
jgi:hypothetical protein